MNLGVLLSLGDSLKNQKESGQLERFQKYYLREYAQNFEKVLIYSYSSDDDFLGQQKFKLIANKFKLHRFLYQFLLPFLAKKSFQEVSVIRVMQATGAIPAIIAKIFFKKPFVTTYGYYYHKFAKTEGKIIASFFLKIWEWVALKTADGVIVTTEELKEYVSQITKSKIYLVPNGVDISQFKPVNKKFNREKIQILSVGRLEKQKNYENLIRAISLSKYKHAITLTLIGRGTLKNRLQAAANTLKVKLDIIESISYDKIPQIYNKVDLFVLPSLIEGHPKVLLEALSCGLPSIASRVAGNIEVIENFKNGLFCTTDSDNIVKMIDALIENDDLRKAISKDARQFIIKNYDIKQLVLTEIKLLQSLGKYA